MSSSSSAEIRDRSPTGAVRRSIAPRVRLAKPGVLYAPGTLDQMSARLKLQEGLDQATREP